jgi:DNA-binding beta-propeller fold protein YncE
MLRPSAIFRVVLLGAAWLAAGCHWTLTDPSTDPKSHQFDFPTGIAMDPGGRYAYVSNGNADLAFGGGTLMIVDLLAFECTVAEFRAQLALKQNQTPPPIPPSCTGLQKLAQDNLKDLSPCRLDPSDPSIVDCDEGQFIVRNATVRIGNFGGEIRLQHSNSLNRLFVAVRGDPSITWADIRTPDDAYPSLDCQDKTSGTVPFVQSQPLTVTNTCGPGHQINSYTCTAQPNCLIGLNDSNHPPGTAQLPTEPFAMQIDEGTYPDVKNTPYSRMLVGAQGTGQVSLIKLDEEPPKLVYESNPFFQPDAQMHHGVFGMAQQHKHDPSSTWYLTTNLFPELATFRIAEANVVQLQTTLSLQTTYAFGNDIRDIQFDASGNRAFVTENNPPSVITLDTRVLPGATGGLPVNAVVSNVDVCQTPSHFGVRTVNLPGAPGEPTQLRTRIYVVCFLSSQVMVVDPDLPAVLATVFSGIAGPNEIAFNFASDDALPVDQVTPLFGKHRAYVTNYSESTIAVLDLEPGSPTENRVVARIGFPPTGPQP